MPGPDIYGQNVVGKDQMLLLFIVQSLCSICPSLQPCCPVGYPRGQKSSCRNVAVTTLHFQNLLGLLSAGGSLPSMSSGILVISSFTYNSAEYSLWIFLDSVLLLEKANEIWENYRVDS